MRCAGVSLDRHARFGLGRDLNEPDRPLGCNLERLRSTNEAVAVGPLTIPLIVR